LKYAPASIKQAEKNVRILFFKFQLDFIGAKYHNLSDFFILMWKTVP